MRVKNATITVADDAKVSDKVQLGQNRIIGLLIPDTWTDATVGFQGSVDGGASFQEVYDSAGSSLAITVAQGKIITFTEDLVARFDCLSHVKLTSENDQGADRVVGLIVHDPSQL